MKILFVFTLSIYCLQAFSQLPRALSTRLLSSSGAGVGSILLNEATLINPATGSYFNTSSFYYSKNEYQHLRDGDDTGLTDSSYQELLAIIDNSSAANGGFSYLHQNYRTNRKKQYSFSFSKPFSKAISLGAIYKYSENDYVDNEFTAHQFLLGLTYVKDEKLSIGVTINDPQFKVQDEFKLTLGFQYTLSEMISFIYDIGTGDMLNPEKKDFSLFAAQFKLFNDLFIRVGGGRDEFYRAKYQSWGISWIGPRLSLDYAFNKATSIGNHEGYLSEDETLVTQSLAFTVLF